MAKLKKKGTSGQAKNFITRTQAVRKLQISLPDFRRLCIFKGIYPREPRNKRKAAKNSTPNTTFYYAKDIQYLQHEPLLQKFREHHALGKKISRALGKGRVADAARLERTQAPRMALDHIIKERYPTFVDALRDLDDCLSMLFLFANLPSHHESVPPKTIALCQRLTAEFQHYLITAHALRKSFLSIKGIYYQASIQGQDVLWLVPYKFVQKVTGDVDFRIMGTFVEFYTTLLGFVNYRLYISAGLVYPPKFNKETDEGAAELSAFTPQSKDIASNEKPQLTNGASAPSESTARAQQLANALQSTTTPSAPLDPESDDDDENEDPATTLATFEKQDPTADSAPDLAPSSAAQSARAAALFAPYVFYLSRETPRAPLEFLLKAFGCARVGWPAISGAGGFTADESDQRITHQIVDRPAAPGNDAQVQRYPGRVYVQPQWVWDSVNAGTAQAADLYGPGAALPPHLSPFVRARAGQYDPTAPLPEAEDAREGEAEAAAEVEEASMLLESEDEEEDVDEVEGVESVKEIADMDASLVDAGDEDGDDFGGFSEDEAGEEKKAVAAPKVQSKADKKAAREREQKAWEIERRKMMLPRKKQALYERVAHSKGKRDAETEKLQNKRRKLEAKGAR